MPQSNIVDIRRSCAPIHKLNPDILYYIFTYVIYHAVKDRITMKTAIIISHVCLYWRKSALGWPTLWRFIDVNNRRKLIELFLSRSGDTPLELLYEEDRRPLRGVTPRLNLESYGSVILPRLCSLTLYRSLSEFLRVQNTLRPFGLQPFRLRCLDITEYIDHDNKKPLELADVIPLEASCLQSLKLHGLNLPWLKLPHNNVLTELTFHPTNPPILSQLLVFLSTCPLLRRLSLDIFPDSALEIETPTSPLAINRVDLPKLELLDLDIYVLRHPSDLSSFYYMRELSSRIGTMGLLSDFSFHYIDHDKSRWHNPSITTLPPSNLFGLIPQETFRHFSNLVYLTLSLSTNFSRHPSFHIYGEYEPSDIHAPLTVYGIGVPSSLFDHFLFEVIHTMPQIAHLKLRRDALKNLISWGFDFRNAFPCLDTLELELHGPKYEDFKSIPMVFPKVRKLVLNANQGMSPKLLRTITEIVVEVLELKKCSPSKYVQLGKVISTLRQRDVVVFDYPKESKKK